jgi:hypothetical protein
MLMEAQTRDTAMSHSFEGGHAVPWLQGEPLAGLPRLSHRSASSAKRDHSGELEGALSGCDSTRS